MISKQKEPAGIALNGVRIISLVFAAFSIFGVITAVGLFGIGSSLFSSEQKVSESSPHGVDALGGAAAFGIGFAWLAISITVFCLAILIYFLATKKLRKKTSSAENQPIVAESFAPERTASDTQKAQDGT